MIKLKVKLTDLKFPKEITWGSFYYLGAGGLVIGKRGYCVSSMDQAARQGHVPSGALGLCVVSAQPGPLQVLWALAGLAENILLHFG